MFDMHSLCNAEVLLLPIHNHYLLLVVLYLIDQYILLLVFKPRYFIRSRDIRKKLLYYFLIVGWLYLVVLLLIVIFWKDVKGLLLVVSFYLSMHFVSAPKTFASKFIANYDFAFIVVVL